MVPVALGRKHRARSPQRPRSDPEGGHGPVTPSQPGASTTATPSPLRSTGRRPVLEEAQDADS